MERHSAQSPKYQVPIMENMNLDFLKKSKPALGPQYQAAIVEFIGGQGYTLNEFDATIRLRCESGGFRIEFREPLDVPTECLLGRHVRTGYLTDIKVYSGGHVFSLATLYPGHWPQKLRRGEVVSVCRSR